MTATPIPRTLVLTYFGDMDVSALTEKPAGRLPIDTRTLPLERLPEVVDAVGRAVASGARVYWVCPLVEESSEVDLAAAEDRAAALRARFGERVGLIHGRLKGSDKDAAMARFAAGETDILVATTVIEVGVDVPEATVMVIEHAERFGLAQLHQLRGRIGRGDKPSTCLLLYKGPLGETAKARLAILRDSEDGFRIAEEDLRLRGEGDVLGTRQSGFPGFKLARLETHGALLPAAREEAAAALAGDPALASEHGRALRVLLHLFERTEAVRLLQGGVMVNLRRNRTRSSPATAVRRSGKGTHEARPVRAFSTQIARAIRLVPTVADHGSPSLARLRRARRGRPFEHDPTVSPHPDAVMWRRSAGSRSRSTQPRCTLHA